MFWWKRKWLDRELTLTAPHLPIRQVTFSCVHGGGRKSLAQEPSATKQLQNNWKMTAPTKLQPHCLPNDTSRHKKSNSLAYSQRKLGFFIHSITFGHRGRMIDQIRLLCSQSLISRSYSSFTTSMMSCAAACCPIKCFQQDLMWTIVISYSHAPFLQLEKQFQRWCNVFITHQPPKTIDPGGNHPTKTSKSLSQMLVAMNKEVPEPCHILSALVPRFFGTQAMAEQKKARERKATNLQGEVETWWVKKSLSIGFCWPPWSFPDLTSQSPRFPSWNSPISRIILQPQPAILVETHPTRSPRCQRRRAACW